MTFPVMAPLLLCGNAKQAASNVQIAIFPKDAKETKLGRSNMGVSLLA